MDTLIDIISDEETSVEYFTDSDEETKQPIRDIEFIDVPKKAIYEKEKLINIFSKLLTERKFYDMVCELSELSDTED